MAENSQSTSDVLAYNLDLSKLGRSTLSDLSNTELEIRNTSNSKYLGKLLLILLNLSHKLITVFLAKFNSLYLGYKIRIATNESSTHFSISIAIFGSRGRKPLGELSRQKILDISFSPLLFYSHKDRSWRALHVFPRIAISCRCVKLFWESSVHSCVLFLLHLLGKRDPF